MGALRQLTVDSRKRCEDVVGKCVELLSGRTEQFTGSLQAAKMGAHRVSTVKAVGRPIAEIDTTAVLTRHDRPIDNRGVGMGASARGANGRHHRRADADSPAYCWTPQVIVTDANRSA